MIKFEHVFKYYGKTPILKDLNFTINDGEFIILIGPSGCGKTTTLKTINRLIDIDEGTITIDGKDISKINKVELRRHIGYVIQQIGLFPNMTVAENICVVPKLLKYSKEECAKIVKEMLAMVDMESYADKYPSELSGGQQQRIGVLRAFAASPPIVLMDEPFGALDPQTRDILQNEIKNIQQKLNKTIIFVTHDMGEALKLADTIIFMDKGEIVQMGSPDEILEHPATDRVREFFDKFISGPKQESTVETFMRTNISTVRKNRGLIECAEQMARQNVDTLIVVDRSKKYLGTVSIADIRKHRKDITTIEPIVKQVVKTAHVGDDAKESFDYLLDTGASYVIILDSDDKVVGIITKTSVARSVFRTLWRENK